MLIANIMLDHKNSVASSLCLDYSSLLSDHEHKIMSIVHPNSSILEDLIKLPVEVKILKSLAVRDFFAIEKLKQILNKLKPDLIFAYGIYSARMAKKACKETPIIIVVVDSNLKSIPECQAIISISDHWKDKVNNQIKENTKLSFIPNVIEPPSNYKKLDVIDDELVIGAIGEFNSDCGFDVLIRAIALLKVRPLRCRVLISGSGKEEYNLIRLTRILGLQNIITFVDPVKEMSEFFEQINILCIPSFDSHYCQTLGKGMIHSMPVIISKGNVSADLVKDGHNAILFNSGSAEEVAKAIEKLCMYPDLAKKIGSTASNYARRKFDKHAIYQKIQKVMDSLILEKV